MQMQATKTAKLAAKLEEDKSKGEAWDLVMKMLDHTNLFIKAREEQMAKKLAEEEGLCGLIILPAL